MKALAFRSRGENKDAYDLVYVVRNHAGGANATAGVLRPIVNEPEAKEALAVLREDSDSVETIGPRRAAGFLYGTPNDDAQADAWAAVRDLLDAAS